MRLKICLILLLVFQVNVAFSQSTNDHMFPAAASAKRSINYDERGFLVNGKRTFIVSAGLEYARIPHQLWYDRLMRLKQAGFNCIEIYTFWNFHEPHDGIFDFTGDHDLNAFLKLVKQLNMYSIVRVGPYYCAEWDLGGYPIWLRFKPNLSVREPNQVFEKYVDRFFDKLIPIVSSNQINHGGSVILVQLENEHPQGWGTIMPNEYFKHLQTKALSLGLEVPYFFSGLHHGSDPAGNAASFDDKSRPNPWFSTEFWSVWYNYYGSSQKDADTYGRRTWKIIAHGGNGYNYYMAHGGTNFGYTNNNEDAASYDYGAAVGQTGDLRPIYYQFKRNAFFARTFEDILENSLDAGSAYKSITTDTVLKVTGRHSKSGDIVFIDNPGSKEVSARLNIDNKQLNSSITLSPGEILPIVYNYNLTNGVKLDWCVGRVLGESQQGNTTTLVVYGEALSAGYLQFSVAGPVILAEGKNGFNISKNKVTLNISFNAQTPIPYVFKYQNKTVRVLALNNKLADRTWFVDVKGKNFVITGPEYIANTMLVNNHIRIEKEIFWQQPSTYPDWIYGEGLGKMAIKSTKNQVQHEQQISFAAAWQVKDASTPAMVQYNDQSWMKSKDAPQMGSDDDLTADAWYRTSVTINEAGLYALRVNKGGDRATVFFDDVRVASGNIHDNKLQFNLNPGKHTMAVFTAHDGRDKLFNHLGPMLNTDPKGLSGEVILQKGATEYLANWEMKMANQQDSLTVPAMLNASNYKITDDAFKRKPGYAWFQSKIPYAANRTPVSLNLGTIDRRNNTFFINGKKAITQTGTDGSLLLPLQGLLKLGGTNMLSVFVHSTRGRGGINRPVEVMYDNKADLTLTGWTLKGGPGNYTDSEGWKPLNASQNFDRPAFFKNTFVVNPKSNSNPMWRVSLEGLGHGSVWINDHNIGRYPEKIPVKSMYIPECWLKKGVNTIVVFDEDGKTPVKTVIEAEKVASRDIEVTTF